MAKEAQREANDSGQQEEKEKKEDTLTCSHHSGSGVTLRTALCGAEEEGTAAIPGSVSSG